MNLIVLCSLPLLLVSTSLAQAFTFTVGTATQCDNLEIKWSGGRGPFQLFLSPIFGTPRNVTIPSTEQGSFVIPQLPYPKDQRLLLTMSDATGFGTGGTSQIITVGDPVSGTNCNVTDPGVQFSFELNSSLQQCKPYKFEGYSKAAQPVTILVFVPGGQPQVIHAPPGPQYDWKVNIAAGTPVVFAMIDAVGQQGGASHVENVGASNDNSCLLKSPTSTVRNQPSSTTTSYLYPTPTSSTSTSTSSFSIRTIVGAVAGGILALALLVILGLFYLRKRAKQSGAMPVGGNGKPTWKPSIDGPSYNLVQGQQLGNPYFAPAPSASASTALLTSQPPMSPYTPNSHSGSLNSPNQYAGNMSSTNPYATTPRPQSQYGGSIASQDPYAANPYVPPSFNPYVVNETSASQVPLYQQPPPQDQYNPNAYSASASLAPSPHAVGVAHMSNPSYSESATSNASPAAHHKADMAAAEAGQPQQPRYVVHTDLDEVAAPNADGVIELPPQYSERRVPLAGLPGQETDMSSTAAQSTSTPPHQPQHQAHTRSLSPDGLAYLKA